jgi:general stress protein CsbA
VLPARRLWAAAFLATAAAALLGGTEHAVRPRLSPRAGYLFFVITYLAVGVANSLLLAGAARVAFRGGLRLAALALVGLRFAVFAAFMVAKPTFPQVILDMGVTIALLAGLALAGARRGEAWTPWLAGALAVSLLAAFVQATRLALHEHFNHNDLFHVIQAAGLVLFARAAARLTERA